MRSSFDLLLEECRGNHAAVFVAGKMRFLILDTLAGTALPALVSERLRPRPKDQTKSRRFMSD